MKKSSFIVLLIYCLCACQASKKGGTDFLGERLFLQETDLLIKDTSLLGDYQVIQFELNKFSTIKQIDKILLFEDKIGVVDLGLRTLLIFNHQGTFLYEISHVGNGPGEYPQLVDVCLDPVDSCFAFLTAQRAVMFYSYTGEFKYSIKTEESAQKMAINGNYIYLLLPDRINNDKQEYSIMAIDRQNAKRTALLEQGIRPVESMWTTGYTLIPGQDAMYYLQRFTHRIYKVVGETCTPLYELDLGKFELPDYLIEEGIDKQFFLNEWAKTRSVFSLTNYCELPSGFILCSNLSGFFHYNLQKKELNHFDGIMNEKYRIEFYSFTPVEPVGENIAFILNEDRIISMKEHRKKEHETVALKTLLDHLADDSNPVLFLYSSAK